MDEFTLREELLTGEDSTRQFKRELDDQDKLASEIVAFLNTRGGKIYIGVEDDGTISGTNDELSAKDTENRISNTCRDSIKPPCTVFTYNIRTHEGNVLLIEVPNGTDKPYQDGKKHFWLKNGTGKQQAEVTQLARLFKSGHITYAEEMAVKGTSLGDLDVERLRTYYAQKFPGEALASDVNEDEIIRQLQGIRLMSQKNLSIAAVLLFAKRTNILLPAFNLKAVWFKGTERGGENFYDNRKFEGTLPQQYEQAMAFLDRWNSRLQTGSFNAQTHTEIPSFVFEELLVNAIVHRDYFIQDGIQLFIFDDRIEIISPGALPNSLTEEEALKGIGRDRNPLLLSLAGDLMKYRGNRSGLLRVRKVIPQLKLENNIKAEQVVITIPLQ